MSRSMILLAMAIFSLVYWQPAQARTYEVSSPSEAKHAISQAGRGDVIQFGPGDYRMQLETQRDGITFRGAPGYTSRLLLPGDPREGRHIVGIKHDDITLEYLVIDGEKKNNSGHGLVRVGDAKRLVIQFNRIINSGSAHLSLGGSWKDSEIEHVRIIGNYLCGSGHVGEYGESTYLGDWAKSGYVRHVVIAGNEFCRFTDNAIDLKPRASNVQIYDNYIHDQEARGGRETNTGTIVIQGKDVMVRDNYIQDVIGGKAVFSLPLRGNVTVKNNVVSKVRKTRTLVRKRTSGSGSATEIGHNTFCDTGGAKMQAVSGMQMRDNPVMGSASSCAAASKVILTQVAQYTTGTPPPLPEPEPEPEPKLLPPIEITNITYGETGSNVVRVYVQATEPGADLQMDKRTFKPESVLFHTEAGFPLAFAVDETYDVAIEKEKPANPRYAPGWNFYLAAPYPTESGIRMVAEENWITGAPAVYRVIER